MVDPKILFLSKRWAHHSPSGGYDRAAEHFGANLIARPPPRRWRRLARATLDRRWRPPSFLLDYSYEDLWAERELVLKAVLTRPKIIHVLYGDEQMDFVLRSKKRLGAKLVATFHLPWFRSRARFESQHDLIAANLDAAICVSRDLAGEINKFFGRPIAYFVPHGIDCGTFRRLEETMPYNGTLRLLIVGYHMRNMELIHRTADWAAANKLPIQFTYIGPRESWRDFTGCENVCLLSGVSEDALISAYNNADALFLPVTAATANNSLLEAISCGLPVISTNLGGIPDYLDEDSGWLVPDGDEIAVRDLVRRLCNDPSEAHMKRDAARTKALGFDWRKTSEMFEEVYGKIQ